MQGGGGGGQVVVEFKSPVQSGFFAFFGRKPDWTALGSLGMVPGLLKDRSKVVATGFSKTGPKPVQNWSKLLKKQYVLHFIDVFTSKVCHMASKYYVYTIAIMYKS